MYFDDAKDYYSTLFDDAYYDNIQCTMYVMYMWYHMKPNSAYAA